MNEFYRQFEEKYRGSRELIRSRLEVYLDFLRPLCSGFDSPSAVDLGCGRGEFLEVLLSAGFRARGVDLDEGMLQACNVLGLPSQKGDAIEFLASLPDNSEVVVSAFHVVEHLSFEKLQVLIREAHRVIKPGGIMILETPNPENISVATCSFYLDPTHVKPIPPDLLSFLATYQGFSLVKVLRLQEQSKEFPDQKPVFLSQILFGVSPDYAVVAQKKNTGDENKLLTEAFAKDYGISLKDLCERYDDLFWRSDKLPADSVGVAASRAQAAESRAQAAESRAQAAESRAQAAEAKSQHVSEEAESMKSSFCWRITSPIRFVHQVALGFPNRILRMHQKNRRFGKLLRAKLYKQFPKRPIPLLEDDLELSVENVLKRIRIELRQSRST